MKVKLVRLSFIFFTTILTLVVTSTAQERIAILTPENDELSDSIIAKLEAALSINYKIIDSSLAKSALKAQNFENPFNLSLQQAKNLGNAIGCNFYVLIKAESINRTSLEKGTYVETYAAFFLVSSRTGRLLSWHLLKAEAQNEDKSTEKFFSMLDKFLTRFVTEIQSAGAYDLKMQVVVKFPEFNESIQVRPPMPYRRITPEYPEIARAYLIAATIDAAVDIDEKGNVVNIEILRWAGFGLEEAVIKAIRAMNWRPGEMNKKTLPLRILLRYNFKKTKDED